MIWNEIKSPTLLRINWKKEIHSQNHSFCQKLKYLPIKVQVENHKFQVRKYINYQCTGFNTKWWIYWNVCIYVWSKSWKVALWLRYRVGLEIWNIKCKRDKTVKTDGYNLNT